MDPDWDIPLEWELEFVAEPWDAVPDLWDIPLEWEEPRALVRDIPLEWEEPRALVRDIPLAFSDLSDFALE
jgi:hypothetical protein